MAAKELTVKDETRRGQQVRSNEQLGRCLDCKHWARGTDGHYPDHHGLGKCMRVRLFWDCTEWGDESADFQRVFTKEAEGNLAFVQDGSDYRAELLTLADFGCVQFERA